jgi:hypothetical protein
MQWTPCEFTRLMINRLSNCERQGMPQEDRSLIDDGSMPSLAEAGIAQGSNMLIKSQAAMAQGRPE